MIVRPFLMFQGEAADAIAFWIEVVPDTRLLRVEHFDDAGPGLEGSVKTALLAIGNQDVMVFDSPVKHDFSFTPAFSFFVTCESEAQLETLAARLAEGGRVLMPLGEYGFSRRFAWVEDRYHVSWQINLP